MGFYVNFKRVHKQLEPSISPIQLKENLSHQEIKKEASREHPRSVCMVFYSALLWRLACKYKHQENLDQKLNGGQESSWAGESSQGMTLFTATGL